jgi:hypothetical protein
VYFKISAEHRLCSIISGKILHAYILALRNMTWGEVENFACPRHGAGTWGRFIAPLILYLNAKWRRVPRRFTAGKYPPYPEQVEQAFWRKRKHFTIPGFKPRTPARNLVAIWTFCIKFQFT